MLGYIMRPRIIIKTVRNFYCYKINTDVHIEYCTDLCYQDQRSSRTVEILMNPDCEGKDHCGIACRQSEKSIYDWSCCVHSDLQKVLCQQGEDKDHDDAVANPDMSQVALAADARRGKRGVI